MALCLEGPRILLREITLDDAAALARYWTDNANHLRPWQPAFGDEYGTEAFWRARIEASGGKATLRFGIHLREAPVELVGLFNLQDIVLSPLWSAMLGYSIGEAHEGQGLMGEAVRLGVDHAFLRLGLHRLYASYMVGNERSARVLERAGFQREGVLRQLLRVEGAWQDHVQMSLIHDGWKET
jgi:ribosomal-protein-alanine N-acetyltransferase